ncbi:MAG: hypothetical protein KGI54_15045 [Pseudomonadota bacterium]|nr:hypothetical protein [Pseudomonadota bacterium]
MDTGKEWAELSDRYNLVNDEYQNCWITIRNKFSSIANGTLHENPTDEELKRCGKLRDELNSLNNSMRLFIQKHFGAGV